MRRLLSVLAVTALAVAAAPAFGATKTVRVGDDFFSPSSLRVKKGTTVRWRWVGDSPHNVVVTRGPRKFSSPVKRSGSFRKRLRAKGRYRIVCTIHSGMAMTVRVR